jgi:hypothetical protein
VDDAGPLLILILARCALATAVAITLWLPAWWAAGRLPELRGSPFLRLLVAAGGALVAYLTVVNLAGRAMERSTWPASAWIALNGFAALALAARRRAELSPRDLLATRRRWLPAVAAAALLGLPQWLMAVSTPYWDEVNASAIHITAVHQFAEGVFPPRHNAFPDLPVKYHYGVTMLAGTVRWLTGLTPNVSIDVVSTALWLFGFLFAFHWMEHLRMRRIAALAGASAVLLGGGLAWLVTPWIETYDSFHKTGSPELLRHRFDPALGWWENLIDAARTPVFHLKSPDGTASDLPWDIANQLQQHAVALGVALTLFSAWLFCTWLARSRWGAREPPKPPGERSQAWALLAAAGVSFGLLFLAHAVFGAVAALSAGLLLAARWLLSPDRRRFAEAATFTAAVTALAFAHGGVLSRGARYGTDLAVLTLRDGFGYSSGGVAGFVGWNLAGFGTPLVLAAVGLVVFARRRAVTSRPRVAALAFFATLLLASYLPPQLFYYSYGARSAEEFTEVSKFFFVTHLALGVLAAFGVSALAGECWALRGSAWALVPLLATMAVVPLANVHAACVDAGRWKGFYRSPYPSYQQAVTVARRFQDLKRSGRDVYYIARRDYHYLDALQIEGGSAFTVTPEAYERTGAFMIAPEVVAERVRENGLMARLHPGAEAESGASWYYVHPEQDFARASILVRSRFERLVGEGAFVEEARAGDTALYAIRKSTRDVDEGIERWWRPVAVLQAAAGGAAPLAFYDHEHQQIIMGDRRIALPAWCGRDLVQVWRGRLGSDRGAGFLVGRLADGRYRRGRTVEDLDERYPWSFGYLDARGERWTGPNEGSWSWDTDVPLVADVDGDGMDHVVFSRTGAWLRDGPGPALAGPLLGGDDMPVPVAGRFLAKGRTDLAVWGALTGRWVVGAAATRLQLGAAGDVLVPGDYDGDGRDEAVVWRRSDLTWYGRDMVTGATTRWTFGSPTGVPLPADYDGDGRLDLAYWEPAERHILVSFTHGASVDRVIEVPPGAIPIFVNMY